MNRQSPPSNSDPKNPPAGFSGPSGFSFGSTAARPPIHKSDSTPSNANGNHEPPANPESPAANLARRKWSGPIAEEAQAHAAAWRATQQIGPRGHSRAHSGEVRIGLHPGAGYSPFPGASPIGSPSFNNGLALPPHGLGRSRNASPNSERERFVTGSSAPPPQNGLLLSAPTPQNVPAHKRKRSEGHQTLPSTSSQAPSHQAPAPSNPFGGPYQYPQQPQVRPSPSPFPMDHERQSRHGGMGAPNQAPRPLLPPGPGGIPPPDWDAEPNRSRRAYENEMGYHPDNRVRSNSGGNQQTNPLVSPTGMRSISGGRSNQSMPSTSPQHQNHHHHPSQFHNNPHSHLPHHHHHHHQHQSPENAHQSPPTGRHQQHQHSHATHQHPVDSLSSHNHSRSGSHGLPLTDKEMQLRAAEEAERKEFAIERERERERVNRMGGGGDYARNAEILTSPSKKTREERERERELMRPENGVNGGGGVGSHPHLLHSQSSIHHQHEHPTNQFQHSHPHHHHHHHQVAPPLPIPHRYSAEDRDRDRERERGATYYPPNSIPSTTQTSPVMDRNPNRGGASVGAIPNPSDPFLPAHHSHSHLHAQHQHPPHHHHHHHHHHHSHQVHHSHPSKDQDPLLRSVDHEIGTRPSGLIAPPLPPPPQISQKFELVEPEPISARRSITPPTQVQPQSPLYSEVKLSHDFNSGPQVNNLPVWEYLEKWKRIDRNPMTNGRPRGGTGGSVSSLQNQVTSAVKKVQEVSEKSKETSTSDGRLDDALEKIKDQVVGGESINSLADELQSLRRNRLEKSGGTTQDSEMQDSKEASSSKQTSSNLKEVDTTTSEKPQSTGKTIQKSNPGDQDEDEEISEKRRVSSRPDTSNEPSFNRHLGSYRYDPLVQPLLPGQLLASNVGATIEVRIAGETLGPGVGVERMRSSLVVNEEKEEKIQETNEKGKSGKEEEDKMKEKDSETTKSKEEDVEAKKRREEEELEEIERLKEEKERNWFRSQGRWRLGWRGREFSRSLAADSIESREETTSRPSKRAKLTDAASSSTSASTSQSNTSPYSSALNFWSLRPLVRRKLWGTDVYTDDSDVLAMCVHAGWLEPPILLTRDGKEVPNWVPPGKPARKWLEWDSKEKELEEEGERSNEENGTQDVSMKDLNSTSTSTLGQDQSVIEEKSSDQSTSSWLRSEKERPCDLSVMLRIAPALIAYKGSQRAGIRSRSWGNGHDGVSLYIESVELKEPGYASSSTSSRKSAKARIDHLAKLRLHMAPEIELAEGEKLSLDNHTPQKLVSLDSIFKNHARPSSEKEEKPFWSVKNVNFSTKCWLYNLPPREAS